MTGSPPDPDPAVTPGLEPGGGVAPGETPPDSGQTSGVSMNESGSSRRVAPMVIFGIIMATIVLLFVATGALLLLTMTGVLH